MFSIFVFSFAALLGAECAKITLSLNQGVCLCVNEPNVVAVKDPANPASTIGTLANGACFTSSGGIYHGNGETYYELKDDSNGQCTKSRSYQDFQCFDYLICDMSA